MTRKTGIVSQLGTYFASKGGVMSMEEYKNAQDTPVRFILIKRTIGSWGRLINMIGDLSTYSTDIAKSPEVKTEVKTEVEKTKEA